MPTPSRSSLAMRFSRLRAAPGPLPTILSGCNESGNCGEFVSRGCYGAVAKTGDWNGGNERASAAGESWRRPGRPPARRPAPEAAQAHLSLLPPFDPCTCAALDQRNLPGRHADDGTADFQRPSRTLLGYIVRFRSPDPVDDRAGHQRQFPGRHPNRFVELRYRRRVWRLRHRRREDGARLSCLGDDPERLAEPRAGPAVAFRLRLASGDQWPGLCRLRILERPFQARITAD